MKRFTKKWLRSLKTELAETGAVDGTWTPVVDGGNAIQLVQPSPDMAGRQVEVAGLAVTATIDINGVGHDIENGYIIVFNLTGNAMGGFGPTPTA